MEKNRFDGHVAIVTGGGTGIGKAVAKQLAAEGAKMIVILGRRADKLQDVVNEIGADKCCAMAADVSKEEDVKAFALSVDANQQRLITNSYRPWSVELSERVYRECF